VVFPAVMLCLSAGLPPWSSAEEADDPKVEARLVADATEIEPGSTLRLGVRFKIADGWHIYWRNPGEAGLATAIDFQLPMGFDVGPLQWPTPIAFTQSDGITGYGYEGSVVLATEVSGPDAHGSTQPVTVLAEVSWLACKGVCVLGSTELGAPLTEIPVDPIFDAWDRILPGAPGSTDRPFSLSTTGGLSDGGITHWLRWVEAPQRVEWFPDPSDGLEVGNIRVRTRGGLTRIDADVRARRGVEGRIDQLPSLVVVTGEDGVRRGWEISVELARNSDSRRES
jgi:hypothetical protein